MRYPDAFAAWQRHGSHGDPGRERDKEFGVVGDG